MARPRALPNADIFALARQLVAQGEQPSITKIAEKAKAEFGVSPSYTTLKQVLHEWRQVEAANAPKALPAEFLDAVITALTPLYGRLVGQARAEIEPLAAAAERERDEAETERDRSETERARLVEEVIYLRRQLDETSAREQHASVAYTELSARAATLEAAHAAASARTDELTQELSVTRSALEVAKRGHRDDAERWGRDLEEFRQLHANELSQLHQSHAMALGKLMDDSELARREHANALKQREEQVSALERERLEQRAVAEDLRTRLHAAQEALTVAQTTLERQAKETASFVSAREQLIAELRSIRAEHQVERRDAQTRIESLEAQITALVQARDERYERLLSALNSKGGAQ